MFSVFIVLGEQLIALSLSLSRSLALSPSLSPFRPYDAQRPPGAPQHQGPQEAPGPAHPAQQGGERGVHHLPVQLQQHHRPRGRQEAPARVW